MLKLKINQQLIECGTDEAGRGCLAGPVTAAAVILPNNFKNNILTDSKQLSEKKRKLLKLIIEEQSVTFGVSHIMMNKIDRINILNASILAMQKSIKSLATKPQHIAVDGNRFKSFNNIPFSCIIKGDSKYLHIAAASVLAKNYRDRTMVELDERFPAYDWKNNKGYPTKKHRQAILENGITKYHRKTFQLVPVQYEIEF